MKDKEIPKIQRIGVIVRGTSVVPNESNSRRVGTVKAVESENQRQKIFHNPERQRRFVERLMRMAD